jgi:hypothetical protein
MSRNILVIQTDAAEVESVRRSLSDSLDGPFNIEWVSECAAGASTVIRCRKLWPACERAAHADTLFLEQEHAQVTLVSRFTRDAARLAAP